MSRAAVADVEDCENLGAALTEHSCFHAQFGPFDTVEASPGTEPSSSTANIDSVHTEYRVILADTDGPNVVTYSPVRSGQWVVFTASDIPLIVETSDGEPLPLLRLDQGTTGCDALPIARTFELVADDRYQFLLGPHDVREAVLVVEYADDFLVSHSRDRDGDGYGDPGETTEPSTCTPEDGWAAKTGDCDDADPDVHPGALETCDDVDRNCNGLPDDAGLHCRSGKGSCEAMGTLRCSAQDGSFAACDASEGDPTSESCNGSDDDCDGLIDEGDDLCSDSETPSCVRHEMGRFCGCLADPDCGSPSSGRICDSDTRTCRDGCRSSGGNGCPSGQQCETTPDNLMRCVDEETWDAPDRRPDLEEPPTDGTTRGGCSCQQHGQSGRQNPGALVSVMAILGVALARRRRALIAVAGLGVGCGGQVSMAEQHDTTDETQCELVLARDPIDHACSHGSHGPYASVVAASLDEKTAPAVDEVHVPYTVDLHDSDESWLSYRARRNGEHIVFFGSTNIGLRAEALSEAGWTELTTAPVTLSQACPVLGQGYLLVFQKGKSYRLVLRRIAQTTAHAPVDLFVEHLGAFSGDSLSERCP